MRDSSDEPLNSIEIRHRDAILAAGHDPAGFLFDAQLTAKLRGGYLTGEDAQIIRGLRASAGSRFELVELLPLYHVASENIRTMQQMSADRVAFRGANFVVATQPGQFVTATVDSRQFATNAVDHPEVVRRPDEPESVVWLNTGSVNMLKVLATHFGHALIAPYGDLRNFLSAMAEGANTLDLVARLRDVDSLPAEQADFMRRLIHHAQERERSANANREGLAVMPPFTAFSTDRSLAVAQTVLLYSFVTYLAGHEAGHIYLGHTGAGPRSTYLGKVPSWISPLRADEIDADIVGLLSVWDGMAQNYDSPIEYTWLAPVLFLAARAGMAAALAVVDPSSAQAVDDFNGWVDRLRYLVRSIAVNLRGNSFEASRIRSVLRSVPPLAGAVYAWLQAGGMRTQPVLNRDQFDWSVYDLLKADCSNLQLEFGL
jgi:hypothetical protein